jgi:hypothetical protein
MAKRIAGFTLILLLLVPAFALARQQKGSSTPPAAVASPQAFIRAANQVLKQMSQLIGLPILHPLKESLRSKAEIRAYLVREEKRDKHPRKRLADELTLKQFGLIPRAFHLNRFMVSLLTQQIAGYYDPKAKEFYIANWIPISDQRMVMAHELTHALQDQHFHIDRWLKAAEPNDDAVAARHAVLEGSATISMIEYELRGMGANVNDLPDIAPFTAMIIGKASSSPGLQNAPPYIRDSLLFPYLSGAIFTQRLLKARNGWPGFYTVFARPPVSTQQVMQPSYYLEDKAPPPVVLPDLKRLLGRRWTQLDQNIFGEFGLQEILKQYLDTTQANEFAPDWWGDRYAILENRRTKAPLLVFRLRLDSAEHTQQFFTAYSALLRKKHATASHVFTAPEYLQFDSAHGSVFFDCRADQCLSMEGAGRAAFDRVVKAMHWPRPPRPTAPGTAAGAARASRAPRAALPAATAASL